MKKAFKFLLGIVFAIMVFVPFVKVEARTVGTPEAVATLTSSEENVKYQYDIGIDFDTWFIPPQEEGDIPYALIDGWELYEKVDGQYKSVYIAGESDFSKDIDEPYSIQVDYGKSRTFAVRNFVYDENENKIYSGYSNEIILDHRAKTTLYTNIANGEGCFTIISEGVNDNICGAKNEGRKTYQLSVGSEVTVKATPADGFSFDAWYIFDNETYQPSVSYLSTELEYTFTIEAQVDGDYESIAPAFVESSNSYKVIEGAEQKVEEGKEAEFRINADYSLFEDGGEVYVDDNTTPLKRNVDYTSEEGSTKIKLNTGYISTLSAGEHTLKVTFNDDNTATTSFTVTKNTSNTENNTNSNVENEITPPPTGIDNPATRDNVLFYVSMLILSIVGFSSTILISRKKFN